MNLLGEHYSAHITSQACSNCRLMSKLSAVIVLSHLDLDWLAMQQKITNSAKVDEWLNFWWLSQNLFGKCSLTAWPHYLGMVPTGPRPDHRQTPGRQLQGLYIQCYLCFSLLILLLDFNKWDPRRLSPIREMGRASFCENEHGAAKGYS